MQKNIRQKSQQPFKVKKKNVFPLELEKVNYKTWGYLVAGYGKWRFPSGLDDSQRVESKPRLAERVVTCTLTHIGNSP